MKPILVLIACAGLMGCGANGAPFTPTVGATNGPVTISVGS